MAGSVSIGKLTGHIELEDKFTPTLDMVEQRLGKAGARFDTLGGSIKNAGSTLLPFSAAVGAVGIGALKMSVDFNAAMANVASLIPGNITRVQELKANVQDMAVVVGKSTGDLAAGLYQVVSAFGDTADTSRILEINAKAAAAGLATTTDAINLTSAVTKGYGDTSAEAVQHASDLAFVTVKLGQTTFPELAGSIGQVTPIAAALNVEQEELFASFATLTGVTGSAAEVSTQLRSTLAALLKPTDAMKDAIKTLGFESGKALIEQEGMVGAMRALIGTTDGSEEALTTLFQNVRALPAVFALSAGQAETFDEKLQAMQETAGATDEAFKEQTEGINAAGFAWQQFTVELQLAAEELGDALAPAATEALGTVRGLVGIIRGSIESFGGMSEEVRSATFAIGGMIAIAGPGLIALGASFKVIAISAEGFAGAIGFARAATFSFGNTVPVLTARLWLMQAASTATGVAIKGFLATIGPAVVLIASTTAVLTAGYQAWKLYGENKERAASASRQQAVDEANLQRIIEATGKQFDTLAEATAYVDAERKKLVETGSLTAAAELEVTEGAEEAAEATQKAAAQTKEFKDALAEIDAVGMGWQGTLETINGEVLESVKYYLQAGVAQDKLALLYDLTATQVQAVATSLKEEERALRLEAKAVQEVTKLWGEYNTTQMSRTGSSIDLEIAKINEWADNVTAAAQRAGTDTAEFYEALEALTRQKLEGVKINWDDLTSHTKQSLEDTAEKARATYEYVLANASQFTREFIDQKREESRVANEAVRDFGKTFTDEMGNVKAASVDAGDTFSRSMGGAVSEVAEKVRTLSGEFITLKEAAERKSAGGSFTINRGNLKENVGWWGVPVDAAFAMAEQGFSFQEIITAWQKGMVDEWIPSGPRIPGFKMGGIGDFGDGTLVELHGREMITPLPSGGSAALGGGPNIVINVNGTATDVARKVSDEVMRRLKMHRQFGSA